MAATSTNQANTVQRMAEAASNFLAALDAAGQQKAVIDFADRTERENWHYVPRERAGLPLKEMDARQRELAHALVATGVSASGYEKVSTIISLEPILAELEGAGRRFQRDPELYYVSIFGVPGEDAPWGWRFEGHHVSLNYTIVEGRMLGSTPLFFGSNPAEVRHGEQTGLRALREEEDLGRQLLHELDGEQKAVAIVSAEAPGDILTTNVPHVRGEVEPEGLGQRGDERGATSGLGRLDRSVRPALARSSGRSRMGATRSSLFAGGALCLGPARRNAGGRTTTGCMGRVS